MGFVMFSHCHSREHSNRHSREHSIRHSCEHSNRHSREHSIRHSCESRNPERRRSRIGQICICEIVSLLGSVDIPIRQLRHSCGACPCESREQESSIFQMAQMSRNRLPFTALDSEPGFTIPTREILHRALSGHSYGTACNAALASCRVSCATSLSPNRRSTTCRADSESSIPTKRRPSRCACSNAPPLPA